MSNEWRKRALPAERLRASASAIVRPMTNCSAISRIACRIATRTTGSPARATTRSYQLAGSLADSASICVSLPVSISPQVDALTSSDGLCPRCFCQSPRESLSRISRSAVSASGMRNSASATHISSTPSCVDRSYCCRNDSMPALPAWRARTASTQPRARALIRADAAASAARQRQEPRHDARFVREEIGADRRRVGAFGKQWIVHLASSAERGDHAISPATGWQRARPPSPRCRPVGAAAHDGEHVRRFDRSGGDLRLVALVYTVDEFPVRLTVGRKIGAESTIDKRVDDVCESEKHVEAEAVDQQRQDILRADSFKAFGRAIPVEKFRLPVVRSCRL